MNCQLDTPAALPRSKQPLVRMLGGPLVDVVAVEQERSPTGKSGNPDSCHGIWRVMTLECLSQRDIKLVA